MSSGTKKLPHDLGTPARGDLSWLPYWIDCEKIQALDTIVHHADSTLIPGNHDVQLVADILQSR
jgi:hypothetical protein